MIEYWLETSQPLTFGRDFLYLVAAAEIKNPMQTKLTWILIALLVFTPACAPQAGANPSPTAPAARPSATSDDLPAEPDNLTILAAASLTEAFTELGAIFETKHPGVKVAFSFAGSQQLAQQLDQGVPADVFASASGKYMDSAVTSGRVNPGEARIFARNRLVVIYPRDNQAGITSLADLARPGLLLDFADKTVPVGQSSLDFLDRAAGDAGFDPGYPVAVLKNVVSYEDNVKAVVTKVVLGEADAGIVYVTDITASVADQLGTLAIPDALNPPAAYPIAALADSAAPRLAQAFVDLVLSAEGQAVLSGYGFLPSTP